MKASSTDAAPFSAGWSIVVLLAALALLGTSPLLHHWLHGRVCGRHGSAAAATGSAAGKPHPFAMRLPDAAGRPPAGPASPGSIEPARAPAPGHPQ